MALDAIFHFARVKGADRGRAALLYEELQREVLPRVDAAGGSLWGAWAGLFGMAGNELLVITSSPTEANEANDAFSDALREWEGVSVVEERLLSPTVRPRDATRLTRQGLYVFRNFDLLHKDCDEFARLSEAGWVTFENDEAYQSEPHGLFAELDPTAERGTMLLVTWYESLTSWQRSRQFPPDARDNFTRRGELTFESSAIATRLLAG